MLGSDFSYRSGDIKDQRARVVRGIEHKGNLLFSFQQKVRTFRPHMKSLIRQGGGDGKGVLEGWENWRSLNTPIYPHFSSLLILTNKKIQTNRQHT